MVGESGGIKVYNAPQQTGMLLRHKMFLINSQVEHQHSVAKWSAISSFLLYSAASLHLLFQIWLLKMGIWSLLLPIFLFLLLAMETQCKVHVCRQLLVRCLTAIFTNIQTLKFKSRLHNWCRQSYFKVWSQETNFETQKHTKWIKIHQAPITNHDLLNPLK